MESGSFKCFSFVTECHPERSRRLPDNKGLRLRLDGQS